MTGAASQTVFVDEQGTAYPSAQAEFVYAAVKPVVRQVEAPVVCYDENGAELQRSSVTVTMDMPAFVSAPEIPGYVSSGDATVTLYLNSDGTLWPEAAVFRYIRAAAEANVSVLAVTEDGARLDAQTFRVTENAPLTFAAPEVPGYQVIGDGVVTVTVDPFGQISPSDTVVFTYAKLKASAMVTAVWRAADGQVLDTELREIKEGEQAVFTARTFDGYALVSPETVTATVTAAGAVVPEVIEFVYQAQPAATPVPTEAPTPEPTAVPTARLIVRYADDLTGSEIAAASVLEGLTDNTYFIRPMAEDLSADYELVSAAEVAVTVWGGMADPAEVVFRYQRAEAYVEPTEAPTAEPATPTPAPTPVPMAEVRIRFVDADQGDDIAAAVWRTDLAEGVHELYAQPYDLPEGYEPVGETTAYVSVSGGVPSVAEVIFTYRKVRTEATEAPELIVPVRKPTPEPAPVEALTPEPTETAAPTVAPTAAPTETPKPAVGKTTATPKPGAVLGEVTVRYQDTNGRSIAPDQVVRVEQGTRQVWPDANMVPDDYVVEGVSGQRVKVNSKGRAEPKTITFKLKLKSIPMGEPINRFGKTNAGTLNLREEPSTASYAVYSNIKRNVTMWMLREVPGSVKPSERWYEVIYKDHRCYIMSKYMDMMSQADSDKEQQKLTSAGNTPVPMNAEEQFVTAATATPPASRYTAEPTTPVIEAITPTPAPGTVLTPVPEQYVGYALTNGRVELRDGAGTRQSARITRLQADTLVHVNGQVYRDGEGWSRVTTLDQMEGFVRQKELTPISARQAQSYLYRWEQAHPTAAPAVTPVPTAAPAQYQGYFYTCGDNVPFRNMPNDRSVILDVLTRSVPVFVTGQIYGAEDGWVWHSVQVNGILGYIRSDMLRMMSGDELWAFLNDSVTPVPTVQATPKPYDVDSLSSYGYVYTSNSGRVNVRQQPSVNTKQVGELRNYALCLIMEKVSVANVDWYFVEYNGIRGYVRGDLFHQLSLAELEHFIDSDLYDQGLKNNAAVTVTVKPGGPLVSQEEQNVTVWTNPQSGLDVTYATWVPMATVAPLPTETPAPTAQATISFQPYVTEEPVATDLPVITETPAHMNTKDAAFPLGWIALGGLSIILAGGVYALVLHRRNQRMAAQRAAQRRQAIAHRQRVNEAREAARRQQSGEYPGDERPAAQRPYSPQQMAERDARSANRSAQDYRFAQNRRDADQASAEAAAHRREQPAERLRSPYQRPAASPEERENRNPYQRPSATPVEREQPDAASSRADAPTREAAPVSSGTRVRRSHRSAVPTENDQTDTHND